MTKSSKATPGLSVGAVRTESTIIPPKSVIYNKEPVTNPQRNRKTNRFSAEDHQPVFTDGSPWSTRTVLYGQNFCRSYCRRKMISLDKSVLIFQNLNKHVFTL